MNKTIDNETLLLKVESFEHRIEVLENTLNVAKEVLTLEEAALFMGISKSSLYKMDGAYYLILDFTGFAKEEMRKGKQTLRNFGYYQWDSEIACTTI